MDIEWATDIFYSILNSIFSECVSDSFSSIENRPPWLTNALQGLRNLKTNTYKKYKMCGGSY